MANQLEARCANCGWRLRPDSPEDDRDVEAAAQFHASAREHTVIVLTLDLIEVRQLVRPVWDGVDRRVKRRPA